MWTMVGDIKQYCFEDGMSNLGSVALPSITIDCGVYQGPFSMLAECTRRRYTPCIGAVRLLSALSAGDGDG